MTVCIAAISGNQMIWGAADRMVSAADIEFEPFRTKINRLTNSISVMTAGNAALHSEIYQDVSSVVNERVNNKPEDWWAVKDIANLYVQCYNTSKITRIEAEILAPFGLNLDTFIAGQQQMSTGFVSKISRDILGINMPRVSAIIAGIDEAGPHIYVVRGEVVHCMDSIGFASIGIGSRHAESQFMFARHSRHSPIAETLLLTFFAKKLAEVAPGVGRDTVSFPIKWTVHK